MQETPEALTKALSDCATGNRDALRTIFDSEGGRMVAVAQRIVRRREVAEDIVQDAFVQIWSKASQYTPDRGSARGWMYAIVRNRALNHLRDGRREDLADEDGLAAMSDAGMQEETAVVLARLDPTSRLRSCLTGLDEAKRHCILMAYIYGYSHGEIAGRLRIPLGTAKAWIRRGLASLRECMA